MNKDVKSRIIVILLGLLVVAVAAQSIVMVKLYQRSVVPEANPENKPVRMDIQPRAGAGQPLAANAPNWNPPPALPPFGRLGYNPGTWDPFQDFRNMRQQMDQMFNDSFGRLQQAPDVESFPAEPIFAPSMDVEVKEDNYVVRIDLPGADKSNISVSIDDRELTVSGKIDQTLEEQGRNHLRKERRAGAFRRSLTLPGPVKEDEMQARYEKGVLTVTVPQAAVQGTSRRIAVK